MAANARLDRAQMHGGALAQCGEQVIGHLRVIRGARHSLEAEQIHRLLVELIHGGASKFAGRLQQRGGGKAHRRGLLQAVQ